MNVYLNISSLKRIKYWNFRAENQDFDKKFNFQKIPKIMFFCKEKSSRNGKIESTKIQKIKIFTFIKFLKLNFWTKNGGLE